MWSVCCSMWGIARWVWERRHPRMAIIRLVTRSRTLLSWNGSFRCRARRVQARLTRLMARLTGIYLVFRCIRQFYQLSKQVCTIFYFEISDYFLEGLIIRPIILQQVLHRRQIFIFACDILHKSHDSPNIGIISKLLLQVHDPLPHRAPLHPQLQPTVNDILQLQVLYAILWDDYCKKFWGLICKAGKHFRMLPRGDRMQLYGVSLKVAVVILLWAIFLIARFGLFGLLSFYSQSWSLNYIRKFGILLIIN